MANSQQLAKTLAGDVVEFAALIAEAREVLQPSDDNDPALAWQWQREFATFVEAATEQLYIVKDSLLAYAEAVDSTYVILSDRMVWPR